jgi:hypothetical protein
MDLLSSPVTTVSETVAQAAREIEPMIDPGSANNSGHTDFDPNAPQLPAETKPPA